jgi:hypothetical protein
MKNRMVSLKRKRKYTLAQYVGLESYIPPSDLLEKFRQPLEELAPTAQYVSAGAISNSSPLRYGHDL